MASIYDIEVKHIDGTEGTLADYRGKVLLVVNVASKCGLTPQYEGLEKLYEANQPLGLEVLGFPANDFAGQEPGSEAEIASFCSLKFNVQFPMFSKISAVGKDQHPLYAALTAAQPAATGDDAMRDRLKSFGMTPNPPPDVLWNFEKFLVGRGGDVVARFAPSVTAEDPRLLSAIELELSK
ncbi:glutathione peroxidase [Xanthobacter sp. KR7-65]|uniref:glutathione peroxidase n=1 Tax=Xanthobacter sp. KR7-65 TaxID=3156612 RepID=UPI0032B576AE